jgi:hypothetical protein
MIMQRTNSTITLSLVLALCACDSGQKSTQGLVAQGRFLVQATTHTGRLTIAEGASIEVPEGKLLTLTVNGVDSSPTPGTYTGDVVLNVTDDIPVKYHDLEPHHFRTAVYIDNGKLVNSKSVLSAVTGGAVDDHAARDVHIVSREALFNGIYVTGDSDYLIENAHFDFVGNGGNDFAGFGAAITAKGNARLQVRNVKIVTKGAIRTAVFVGGKSIVHVDDSTIDVANGTLPTDYKFTVEVGKMMEVPWMLGLSGNVRATNLLDEGTVYYTNCHIRTQGWGALSTDDNRRVRMFVKNSIIETIESGYGAYSIGDSHDLFSGSTLNVADIGVIMAGEGSATFTDGTVVNSGRFGVMMHSGAGGGTLTIDKQSVVNSKSTAIQVKGIGTTIVIDNAKVIPGNGILVQAMPNDDPYLANGPPPGMPPPPGMSPPPGPDGKVGPPPSPDVVVTLRNTQITGDVLNARVQQGDLRVRLENAQLTGAVSTSTATAVAEKTPTAETRRLIGEVRNKLGPSTDARKGAHLFVDAKSRWVVTQTSYLSQLRLEKGAQLVAVQGKRVALYVGGKPQQLVAGNFEGKVELRVSEP